jgi:hypothetical protein
VDVEAKGFERALALRMFTEDVCVEQRGDQFSKAEEYAKFWKGLRPKLDPTFAKRKIKRPRSFVEATKIARRDGGVLWSIGADLYKHESGIELSESEIKAFMKVCPPFLAVCYAICGSWFDWSLRPTHEKHVRVGRNDLLMATCLPYCDRFVTNDWAQQRRLAEIAAEAEINCKVLSYRTFCKSFELVA